MAETREIYKCVFDMTYGKGGCIECIEKRGCIVVGCLAFSESFPPSRCPFDIKRTVKFEKI